MLSKSEDYSTIKICEMQEMKEEIKELKINLSSTQNELENTIIENNEYKREINKLKKEIEVLKNICQSPIIKGTNEINKGFHVSLTPSNTSKYSHSSHFSPISSKKYDKKCNNLIISLQNKIKESQEQLLNAKKEITELENQIQELSIKLTTQRHEEQLTSRDKTENNKKNNAFTKQNIFIMGTQQCIGLAAELTKSRMNSRYEDYQVTAFIKPFASTEEVLKLCTSLKVDTHDKNSQNICKASWKLIKDVTESEPPQNYITHMKYENSIITNGAKIAELFNDYYVNLTDGRAPFPESLGILRTETAHARVAQEPARHELR
ncbi:unnamed protein product [Parnassius apollo]|uniref:(apollo) hypothetical protein n=1 Tax=Parnassius apollo TaxID=110799 RepID=A0A8S3WPS8_PARAO|nr:unnamed protein product [Parnassius apollo]